MEGKPKVLLIEDEELIAKAYKEGLERGGLEVVIALDGEKGLELLRAEKPDMVLLDLILPGKDGFAILEEIRANDEIKDIPVIIITVSGADASMIRAKNLGAVDYLVKTDYSMKEVVDRVRFRLGLNWE